MAHNIGDSIYKHLLHIESLFYKFIAWMQKASQQKD